MEDSIDQAELFSWKGDYYYWNQGCEILCVAALSLFLFKVVQIVEELSTGNL